MVRNHKLALSISWCIFPKFVTARNVRKLGMTVKSPFSSESQTQLLWLANPVVKSLSIREWTALVCNTHHFSMSQQQQIYWTRGYLRAAAGSFGGSKNACRDEARLKFPASFSLKRSKNHGTSNTAPPLFAFHCGHFAFYASVLVFCLLFSNFSLALRLLLLLCYSTYFLNV